MVAPTSIDIPSLRKGPSSYDFNSGLSFIFWVTLRLRSWLLRPSKCFATSPCTCWSRSTFCKLRIAGGGINRKEYLSQAVFFGEGEYVHPNYLIRKGHSIYNLEVSKLVRPIDWLKSLIY